MTGLWLAFLAFVLLMLALDLGVFHRRAHEVRMKEALLWSAVWVGLALGFTLLPEQRAIISAGPMALAFSFSIAVGLFFGLYPALRAARMDPIEALRYE